MTRVINPAAPSVPSLSWVAREAGRVFRSSRLWPETLDRPKGNWGRAPRPKGPYPCPDIWRGRRRRAKEAEDRGERTGEAGKEEATTDKKGEGD
jgi:hypothetical protein